MKIKTGGAVKLLLSFVNRPNSGFSPFLGSFRRTVSVYAFGRKIVCLNDESIIIALPLSFSLGHAIP